jgi:hypothetical protein
MTVPAHKFPFDTHNAIDARDAPLTFAPGDKQDAQKPRPGLVIMALANAINETAKVMTYGAQKYTDHGWYMVDDGVNRYTEALLRHLLAEGRGEPYDPETKLLHAAHTAANALIRLELMLREDRDIPF